VRDRRRAGVEAPRRRAGVRPARARTPGPRDAPLLRLRPAVKRLLFGAALVAATALALTFLLLPVAALFLRVSPGRLFGQLGNPVAVDALFVSLKTSAIAHALVLVVGTPAAYLLATRRFRGRGLVVTLVE